MNVTQIWRDNLELWGCKVIEMTPRQCLDHLRMVLVKKESTNNIRCLIDCVNPGAHERDFSGLVRFIHGIHPQICGVVLVAANLNHFLKDEDGHLWVHMHLVDPMNPVFEYLAHVGTPEHCHAV